MHHVHLRNAEILNRKPIFSIASDVGPIAEWMESNLFKLNPAKSEFVWCATLTSAFTSSNLKCIWDGDIIPASSVRNQGSHCDGSLFTTTDCLLVRTSWLISSLFYQLQRIPATRRSVPTGVEIRLHRIFLVSRIDYCNSLPVGFKPAGYNIYSQHRGADNLRPGKIQPQATMPQRKTLLASGFPEICNNKCCLLLDKTRNGQLSAFLRTSPAIAHTMLRCFKLSSATQINVTVHRYRKKIGVRSFLVAGSPAWNLPFDTVKTATSDHIFKKRLKSHLFHESYDIMNAIELTLKRDIIGQYDI